MWVSGQVTLTRFHSYYRSRVSACKIICQWNCDCWNCVSGGLVLPIALNKDGGFEAVTSILGDASKRAICCGESCSLHFLPTSTPTILLSLHTCSLYLMNSSNVNPQVASILQKFGVTPTAEAGPSSQGPSIAPRRLIFQQANAEAKKGLNSTSQTGKRKRGVGRPPTTTFRVAYVVINPHGVVKNKHHAVIGLQDDTVPTQYGLQVMHRALVHVSTGPVVSLENDANLQQ